MLFTIDIGDFDNRNIERASTQVINRDLTIAFFHLVHTKRQSGCGRLVDDALDVQARDAACVLGCLTLTVVEVSRHSNDGLGHFFAQKVLGGLFHFAQYIGRHLRGSELFVLGFDPCIAVVSFDNFVRHQVNVFLYGVFGKLAADQPFDSVKRVGWIGHSLSLSGRADQGLAVFHVGDDRGGRAGAFGVFQDFDLIAIHDGHAAIGGAKVNTDNLTHGEDPLKNQNEMKYLDEKQMGTKSLISSPKQLFSSWISVNMLRLRLSLMRA